MSKLNIGIIGGGIVGLALAYKLQLNNSKSKITLFEKENKVGSHHSSVATNLLLKQRPSSIIMMNGEDTEHTFYGDTKTALNSKNSTNGFLKQNTETNEKFKKKFSNNINISTTNL